MLASPPTDLEHRLRLNRRRKISSDTAERFNAEATQIVSKKGVLSMCALEGQSDLRFYLVISSPGLQTLGCFSFH